MDKKKEIRVLDENDSFRVLERGDELIIENKATGKRTFVQGNQLFTTEKITFSGSGRKTINGVKVDAESITIEEGAAFYRLLNIESFLMRKKTTFI